MDENGTSIVTIFGQEKDHSTAGLATMNLILHQKGNGQIAKGNTLIKPQFKDEFSQLKRFDFVVMNPPFSDKSWSDGLKADSDPYKRFDGFGIPPEKNGDYAWFLHVLKSLNSTGKAGIVMPHGVLFRGNAEETIRTQVLNTRYIKGIISLPANLFYGTGIPACLIFLDKEDADTREDIFFIDASNGFKKDGNKNRLREQDIERIVRVYTSREEIKGYSRRVPYSTILEKNNGNLNVPRYIQKIDDTLPQNIAAHLKGGIPKFDIDSLSKLWIVSPELKASIFKCIDPTHDIYHLALESGAIEDAFDQDQKLQAEKALEGTTIFESWRDEVRDILLSIIAATEPKELVRQLGSLVLTAYADSQFLDNYDIYDCLMNYWNEKLQDDVYAIKAYGYEAAREVEYQYAQKKAKDANGETISVDDKSKVKSFEGSLIPRSIIEAEYFSDKLDAIQALADKREQLESELNEMREEESGEDGLLTEVLTEGGDLPKANLTKRLKELEVQKTSPELDALTELMDSFGIASAAELEQIIKATPSVEQYGIRNKNGTLAKAKLKAALKAATADAVFPESYKEEYNALLAYQQKLEEQDAISKAIKAAQKELDDLVLTKYEALTLEEIKHLLFDEKWMAYLYRSTNDEIEQILSDYASRVIMIAKRYEHTLGEIEDKTAKSKAAVMSALERMGYKW